jgi:hypothetical protein
MIEKMKASSLVECSPATQAAGVRSLDEKCLAQLLYMRMERTLVKSLQSGDPCVHVGLFG